MPAVGSVPKRRTAPPAAAPPPVEIRRRGDALDDADRRLIELLMADGRSTNRALALEVGLTEATVGARIRNLVERRILGVTAVFDWEAAGYEWSVYLPMASTGEPPRKLAEQLATLPGVFSTSVVFGSVDLWAHALFPTRADLMRFLTKDLGSVKGVRLRAPFISLETVKYYERYAPVGSQNQTFNFPAPVIDLDDFDHRMLEAVANDGRQSNREIARQLGVSEGTVRTRLRRIEESGLVRICAQIDPVLAGTVAAWAFVGVSVTAGRTRAVAERLAAVPEVLVVDLTIGPHDILIFLAAPDRARMTEIIADEIHAIRGVMSTETWDVAINVRAHSGFGRNL
jgi:DNA-binding Lrp family transcriptional regulator